MLCLGSGTVWFWFCVLNLSENCGWSYKASHPNTIYCSYDGRHSEVGPVSISFIATLLTSTILAMIPPLSTEETWGWQGFLEALQTVLWMLADCPQCLMFVCKYLLITLTMLAKLKVWLKPEIKDQLQNLHAAKTKLSLNIFPFPVCVTLPSFCRQSFESTTAATCYWWKQSQRGVQVFPSNRWFPGVTNWSGDLWLGLQQYITHSQPGVGPYSLDPTRNHNCHQPNRWTS